MGPSESTLGHLFTTAGSLLAITAFVVYRTLARRRTSAGDVMHRNAAERDRQFRRSIPAALAHVHSQLHDLADEVDNALPRQFRLIDQLIEESDLEIARLQQRLTAASPATISMSHRQPDVLLLEDFEPNRMAVPAVPQFDERTIRRAA